MVKYKEKLARHGENLAKEGWEKEQEPLSPIPKTAKSIIDESKLKEVFVDLTDRTHKTIRVIKRFLAGIVLITAAVFLVSVAVTDTGEIFLALVIVIPVGVILYFVLVGIFNFLFIKERIISEMPQELYEQGYTKIISYEERKEESAGDKERK